MSRPTLRVHLALLAVQLVFGGFHVVGKAVLAHLDPLVVAGSRVLAATPLLLLVAWRRDRMRPRLRDLPILALLGLLGVFANQLLFIVGLQQTTAINAAILMPSIPVFAVAVAAALRVERPSRRRLAGVAAAVLGAVVMLEPHRFRFGGATLGNAMILVNCLSYAAFLVLQRPVFERLPWRTVLAWAFLFGGSGVVAVAWPRLAALDPGTVPAPVWLGLGYIVLFPTLIGYSLNTWAVRRSTPTLVAAYTTLQPAAAAALAGLFLGESVGWVQGAGFGLIAGGLALTSRRRRGSRPT